MATKAYLPTLSTRAGRRENEQHMPLTKIVAALAGSLLSLLLLTFGCAPSASQRRDADIGRATYHDYLVNTVRRPMRHAMGTCGWCSGSSSSRSDLRARSSRGETSSRFGSTRTTSCGDGKRRGDRARLHKGGSPDDPARTAPRVLAARLGCDGLRRVRVGAVGQ